MNGIRNLFTGRINRRVYTIGVLIYVGIYYVFQTYVSLFGPAKEIFSAFVVLCLLLFSMSLIVRRLHDIGYSGWLGLVVFVPFVNVLSIILFFWPGKLIANKYGEIPPFDIKFMDDLLNTRSTQTV